MLSFKIFEEGRLGGWGLSITGGAMVGKELGRWREGVEERGAYDFEERLCR